MQLFTIAAMLFAALGVAFALQNSIPVTVAFLFWRFDSSLALVLLLTLAIGGFIVALVSTPTTLRKQWALARQNKRVVELEKICHTHEKKITELESRLPVDSRDAPVEETPYVSLRQILGGKNNDET